MTAIASNIYFLLLVPFLRGRSETVVFAKQITLGASLSPTFHPSYWTSPFSRFAFGFYQQGDGFKVGIWLFGKINNTILWTANCDDPPAPSNARLVLTMNSELLLQQISPWQNKHIVHSDNGAVFTLSMLDSGNFVLQDKNSKVLWESFDYPTDTLLGGQVLPTEGKLLSSSSDTNQSSGRFQLVMQDDGHLVMYPAYSVVTPWDACWASKTVNGFGSKFYHSLRNRSPHLRILDGNSTSNTIIAELDFDSSTSDNTGSNTIYTLCSF